MPQYGTVSPFQMLWFFSYPFFIFPIFSHVLLYVSSDCKKEARRPGLFIAHCLHCFFWHAVTAERTGQLACFCLHCSDLTCSKSRVKYAHGLFASIFINLLSSFFFFLVFVCLFWLQKLYLVVLACWELHSVCTVFLTLSESNWFVNVHLSCSKYVHYIYTHV